LSTAFTELGGCEVPIQLAAMGGVGTPAFYDWPARQAADPTEARLERAYLVNQIWDIRAESDLTFGSPRVAAELRSWGHRINHKRTERPMPDHDLVGITERKRIRTTIRSEDARPRANLLG
jgi:hypothetical protein